MWQENEINRLIYIQTNQFVLAAFTALATLDNPAPINANGCKDDKEFWVEVGSEDIDAVYMLLLFISPEWQLGNPSGGDAHAGFIRFSFWRLQYWKYLLLVLKTFKWTKSNYSNMMRLKSFLIYLLQNQTRTTSFSMLRLSPIDLISSDVGFGFLMKALSRDIRTWLSIEVLFFRRFPKRSATKGLFWMVEGVVPLTDPSASSNHFSSKGFSLHMFLNERLSASNLEMVVWEKSLPYILPMANPTSPCVYPINWKENFPWIHYILR